jgi:hypothetical protein
MSITPENPVDSDTPTENPIAQAVLKVYSRAELQSLSKVTLTNFQILVKRRLWCLAGLVKICL